MIAKIETNCFVLVPAFVLLAFVPEPVFIFVFRMMETFKPPGEFSFISGNVAENWRIWRQKFENYMLATERDMKPDKTKIAILLNLLGDEGAAIYNTFEYAEGKSAEKFDDVIKNFTEYCVPRRNVVFERHKFFTCSQKEGQNIDAYVTELKTLARTCEFESQEESLIRDRVVLGIHDSALQERLLREPLLTVKKAAEFIRASEISKQQLKTINDSTGGKNEIDAVKVKSTSNSNDLINCTKCGKSHKIRECPAFGKLCNICKLKNHFAAVCRMKNKQNIYYRNGAYSKSVNVLKRESVPEIYIDSITKNKVNENYWCETIQVSGRNVNFKLDTGAEANILPLYIYNELELDKICRMNKSRLILIAYGNNRLHSEGQINIKCSSRKCKNISLSFEVVNVDSDPILGLKACVKLDLVRRVHEIEFQTKDKIISAYEEVFQGLGEFPGKPYHIELKNDVPPVINPPRRVPHALHEPLKSALDNLETRGIISQVNEPTDWVSSLVVVEKPNGKLRICLDPRNLNKAIKREHHIIPSSEEIISRLEGKQFFSVLDLKEGFWQIPLDEISSNLCTFNSPFGRYRFNRLPFGIISAPEVFQKRNQKLFGDIRGVEIYFDDLIIAGKDAEEHDRILKQVLDRAKDNNIKFNPEKFQFKVTKVKYMGFIISKEGIEADKSHIRAITELEQPTNKKDVRRFLGMVNFLSKFIPNVSQVTAPLRELVKHDVDFHWLGEQEQAFKDLKNLISSAPTLKRFSSSKQIVFQCDSSKDGIGVCLLQDDHPVSFASRSLTDTEKNYAQIEKELLAIVFAFTKYHNFVYGHNVLIQTDHKPLLSIVQKPITKISFRLQKMLLKLLKYDYRIQYIPGSQMYLADTLSRAYLKDKVLDDPEMLSTVHTISRYIPMSEKKYLNLLMLYKLMMNLNLCLTIAGKDGHT